MKSTDAKKLKKRAEDLISAGTTAAEFSAAIFGPNGLVSGFVSTKPDREKFVSSKLYKDLQSQLRSLRAKEAQAFDREVEKASGRLTVVVPKSLHVALRSEAEREGVSLSELIRMKLGVPYHLTARVLLGGAPDSEAA